MTIRGGVGIPWTTPHLLRHISITESVHVIHSNVVEISRVVGCENLKTSQSYTHRAYERAHEAIAKLPKLVTVRNKVSEDCYKTL